jgi:hypothetical protein
VHHVAEFVVVQVAGGHQRGDWMEARTAGELDDLQR